jgi:hypothetical protein
MPSQVKIMARAELKSLHAGSLLTRRNRLLACEEAFDQSDRFRHDEKPEPQRPGLIEFKDTPEWAEAYQDVKATPATREHVPCRGKRRN